MLEHLTSPDYVLAFKASGTLTGEEIDRFAAQLDEALARHDRVSIYFDAVDWNDMTGDALAKRIQLGMSRITQANRFPRIAIVSVKEWIRAVCGFSNALFPMREARTFEPDQRGEAMTWASEPITSAD